MDSLDICNLALNQLKAKNILSLEEASEEAAQCKRSYDFCRQQLLRRFPWGFARRITPLTLTDYNLQGYRFLYRYPLDCLLVRRVFNERFIHNTDVPTPTDEHFRFKKDWDILSVAQATDVLATDIEKAYLDYTYDLRDVSVFPPDFMQALIHYLAAQIAPALAADSNLQGINFQLFQAAYREAAGNDSNEDKDIIPWQSRILMARW